MRKRNKIGCVAGIVFLCFSACSQDTDIYLEEYGKTTQETEVSYEEGSVSEITQSVSPLCYVYICGAVKEPGVYAFAEGSRVYEVIEAAGGLTEDAEDTAVNQAELVWDGMMIRIYTREEAISFQSNDGNTGTDSIEQDGRIDINAAGVSELMALPGIGSAKAEAIVLYRNENGGFSCIEDLMKVPGIKEGVFQQMKEHIKVNK